MLLSFTARDSLADALSRQGYRVVAARRAEGIVRRFGSLNSALIVLDARKAFDQALAAAATLSAKVAAKKANILLLYDRTDAPRLHHFAENGITAMLPAPWHDSELQLAIGLARRQAGPLAHPSRLSRQIWWRADMASGAMSFDGSSDPAGLDATIGQGMGLRQAVARFARDDRKRAFAAVRKLMKNGGYTAFSQNIAAGNNGDQAIHHLVMTGEKLAGHVEWLRSDAGQELPSNSDPLSAFPSLTHCFAHSDINSPSKTALPAVVLIQIDGLEEYRCSVGSAATDTVIRNFSQAFERGVRDALGHSAHIARVAANRIAIIATDPEITRRLVLELRLLAATIQDSILSLAHPVLRLRLANSQMRIGDSEGAIFARLTRRLTVPQAIVDQLDAREAIDEGQIIVRFQPQFDLSDDRLIGAEALARWNHPTLGEISGGALFSAARTPALAKKLSHHIWEMALQAMSRWPASMTSYRLALNITSLDMAEPHFPQQLLSLAQSHDIAPERLTVEVTESAVIAQFAQAAANLAILRDAGLQVALDDFGTGYSGLAWLKELPVDYIKIDAGFTRDAHGSEHGRSVLRGIIAFTNALGINILAEGVETIEQRDTLNAMGCRWFQGYLKAPAMGCEDFIAYAKSL